MTTEKKSSFHFQAIVHPIPNGEPNGVEVLKIIALNEDGSMSEKFSKMEKQLMIHVLISEIYRQCCETKKESFTEYFKTFDNRYYEKALWLIDGTSTTDFSKVDIKSIKMMEYLGDEESSPVVNNVVKFTRNPKDVSPNLKHLAERINALSTRNKTIVCLALLFYHAAHLNDVLISDPKHRMELMDCEKIARLIDIDPEDIAFIPADHELVNLKTVLRSSMESYNIDIYDKAGFLDIKDMHDDSFDVFHTEFELTENLLEWITPILENPEAYEELLSCEWRIYSLY